MSEDSLYLLSRLIHIRRAELKARFAEYDCSMGIYTALRELNERDNCPQSELLAQDMDRAAVSRLIHKLTERGFVTVSVHENDRRQAIVSITADGRETFLLLDEICKETDSKFLRDFSSEELACLKDCAERMLNNYSL